MFPPEHICSAGRKRADAVFPSCFGGTVQHSARLEWIKMETSPQASSRATYRLQ